MRFKAIFCQVFTREMEQVVSRSRHVVDVDPVTMGLHDLGSGMRAYLQKRIDAADGGGTTRFCWAMRYAAAAPRGCAPARHSLCFRARTTALAF